MTAHERVSEAALEELRGLAAAATPGPWTAFYKHKYDEHHVSVPGNGMNVALFPDGCPTARPEADAAFIAKSDPQTVLALIEEIERLRQNNREDVLEEALQKIDSWARAYPLDIFPEPDFKKAHAVLQENGMTIDAISASAIRHAIEGIGKITSAALAGETT
jgi:hypothetical protein